MCRTGIAFLLMLAAALPAQDAAQTALDIGREFVSGILRANYREMPLQEILSLQLTPLPRVMLSSQTTHPSLLFSQDMAGFIQSRQYQPPWDEWAQQILQAASQAGPVDSPLMSESERSRAAKLNAFAFFLTQESDYFDQARKALNAMGEPDPVRSLEGGSAGSGWGDWLQAADALAQYAVALDLVWGQLTSPERQRVIRILSDMTDQMTRHRLLIPKNNHAAVIGAGIGTVALALRVPKSQRWLDAGLDLLRAGLANIEADGSYREGAYYGRFVASRVDLFAFYLKNVTGVNLLAQDRLQRLHQWLNDMTRPDGSAPLFDDAFPDRLLYLPVAAALLPRPDESLRLFGRFSHRFSSDDAAWVEAFCAYSHPGFHRHHWQPAALFYPAGGMTLFRSDSLFGLFLGEPGRPRLSGHDHIEPTAFSLFAYGRDMLLDAGYGAGGVEGENRRWFVSARAHNIPRVNGLGPDENPLYGDDLGGRISHTFEAPGFAAATVKARYRESDICRRVWFAHQRYFVILDDLFSTEEKFFSIPWHGLGRLKPVSHEQWQWRQNDLFLDAFFLQDEQAAPFHVQTHVGLHTGDESRHEAAVVELARASRQTLCSLMLPQKEGDALHVSEIPLNGKGVARQIEDDSGQWRDLLILAKGGWFSNGLESDAQTLLFHHPLDGPPARVSALHTTRLTWNGEALFRSTHPVDLVLILGETGWSGWVSPSISGEKGVQLFFHPPADPGRFAVEEGIAEYVWQDGWLRASLTGPGRFEMGRPRLNQRSMEPVRPAFPVLERLKHAANPQTAVAQLDEAQLTQLGNEIIALMGSRLSTAAESRYGEEALEKTFGLVSGLTNSLFGQTGTPGVRLPQVFQWQDRIGGQEVSYREEGVLTEKGLEAYRHDVSVNEALFVSTSSDFNRHRAVNVHLEGPLRVGYFQESYDDLSSRFFHFSREMASGWITFSRAEGSGSHEHSRLGFRQGEWRGDLTLFDSGGHSVVQLGHNSSRQATALLLNTRNSHWSNLHLSHTHRLTNAIRWNGSVQSRKDSAGVWQSRLLSQVWFQGEKGYGSVTASRTEAGEVSGGWVAASCQGRWRVNTRGRWGDREWASVGWTYRQSRFSLGNSWHTHNRMIWNGAVHLSPFWHAHGYAAWQWGKESALNGGIGFWHSGALRLGAELFQEKGDLGRGYGFRGDLGVPGWLDVRGGLLFYSDGEPRRYEIKLTRPGRESAPGLLILGEEGRLVRLEGYVTFIM